MVVGFLEFLNGSTPNNPPVTLLLARVDKAMLTRRRFFTTAGLAGLGLVGIAGASVNQAFHFGITRYRRVLKGLREPIRVAQLSDLHFGPFIKAGSVRAWVEASNAENPDVVVITGDLVDSSTRLGVETNSDLEPLIAELAKLKSRFGTFAIWGNHDNWNKPAKAYLQKHLPKNNITILNNLGRYLRPDFYLAGVDDRWAGSPDPVFALKDFKPGTANLMLAHNPDYWDFLRDSPVVLALSGHTHGGQVVLPGIGAPWTPSYYRQMYLGGFFKPGTGSDLLKVEGFVSRGLGVTTLPMRLNAPAELVIFDFQPQA